METLGEFIYRREQKSPHGWRKFLADNLANEGAEYKDALKYAFDREYFELSVEDKNRCKPVHVYKACQSKEK